MKKFLSLFLMMILCLNLAACNLPLKRPAPSLEAPLHKVTIEDRYAKPQEIITIDFDNALLTYNDDQYELSEDDLSELTTYFIDYTQVVYEKDHKQYFGGMMFRMYTYIIEADNKTWGYEANVYHVSADDYPDGWTAMKKFIKSFCSDS